MSFRSLLKALVKEVLVFSLLISLIVLLSIALNISNLYLAIVFIPLALSIYLAYPEIKDGGIFAVAYMLANFIWPIAFFTIHAFIFDKTTLQTMSYVGSFAAVFLSFLIRGKWAPNQTADELLAEVIEKEREKEMKEEG